MEEIEVIDAIAGYTTSDIYTLLDNEIKLINIYMGFSISLMVFIIAMFAIYIFIFSYRAGGGR